MIPGQPVSLIAQCKHNLHQEACLESFQPIGHFEHTFFEAPEASKMICKVRSLISRIITHSYMEEIMTSSNEVFKDCESDMAVAIRRLGNRTIETAQSNVIVQHTAGS